MDELSQFCYGFKTCDVEDQGSTVMRLLSIGNAQQAHAVLVNWRQECLDMAAELERYANALRERFAEELKQPPRPEVCPLGVEANCIESFEVYGVAP